MKNLKASVPVEWLTGSSFNFYARACGAIVAHSRTSDPARISGYLGNSHALDEALAEWAEAHGDQTKENHPSLLDAIRYCKVAADVSEGDTD